MKTLGLSAFQKAIGQLETSLQYYHSDIVQKDSGLVLQMRAAAIQAFEFTYELAWKMIKRYLMMTEPNISEVEHMSFPDLIRTACERDLLLSELVVWKEYREELGASSHAYSEDKAQKVFNKIPAFLAEVKYLLAKLQERNKAQ